ncbi:hypothetical protein ILUMI_24518 [Ignelater luminosus]|uniref:CUB domain-containing protein n=1 Tax=Ignelater luminosus TaxID=2038154 RepID=A0A8K0CA26_IGNLU|nr:hypothetical protein ILUMI_24518 [Ignelater luminosus]
MWVTYVLECFLIFSVHNVWGYIENVKTSGCESCALRLTCRHFDSIIAVLEATFESLEVETANETLPSIFPRIHPRTALNKRCSGVSYCSFILTKDCPGADKWGLGNLTVNYACVAARRITRHCNKEIILPSPETIGVSQGFVHNPGYPKFYLGKQRCQWKIQAPPLQRITVTIFDISLVGDPNREDCSDLLEVSDSGQTLYSTCEQQEPPIQVTSLGDTLDITLHPSPTESLLPRRGVLFYYTAVGCPTPSAPKDGYLVYRNDTAAEYSCCIGYAFPDIKKRRRIIKCLGHKWDVSIPLPNCDNTTLVIEENNSGLVSSKDLLLRKMAVEYNFREIVAPIVLIVMLFLLNGIALFVIYKYRQRKPVDATEDELGSLPITNTREEVET